ncbi:peptide chain release factor N(5)-glutamine methyltransferase [Mucilaginibacter sp.]|uniref:peptide chain release factor N(5)-glutamine methyltransferase n=1 Tax=Mucilaginibacter sp. TaxID=1882438 RepID=UPI0035BBDDC7
MKTIKDVIQQYGQALQSLYDTRESSAITLLVLEEITGFSRARIKAFPEDELPAGAIEKLSAIATELQTGKPVQYVLGNTEFYGLNFLVNPATLIPRPETEELVDWALKESKRLTDNKQLNILDIGTGSGCIAISLKKNLPGALVTAIDVSATALKTAAQNAVINEVTVEFIEDSILDPKSGIERSNYDIIVSNPPYVTLQDKLHMHQNVTGFEPHLALFVPEENPLLFYEAIADLTVKTLLPGGLLFLEINENLSKETIQLLTLKGLSGIRLRQDMSGRDRMVKATLAAS